MRRRHFRDRHMNDQPKKRPWFQVHLSTAVVLMFVAGGIMWANLSGEFAVLPKIYLGCPKSYRYDGFGWPFRVFVEYYDFTPPTGEIMATRLMLYDAVCKNVLVGVVILNLVLLVCEWRIRRQPYRS